MIPTIKISTKYTVGNWISIRKSLCKNPSDGDWEQAIKVFSDRIDERFMNPISTLLGDKAGAGFTVMAIICLLIEHLQSFYVGYVGTNSSEYLIKSFLSKQPVFKGSFNQILAKDFYKNVRCALLHDACTKKGWIIQARESKVLFEERNEKYIINRNAFYYQLKYWLEDYKSELRKDKALQRCFIKKMDSICEL